MGCQESKSDANPPTAGPLAADIVKLQQYYKKYANQKKTDEEIKVIIDIFPDYPTLNANFKNKYGHDPELGSRKNQPDENKGGLSPSEATIKLERGDTENKGQMPLPNWQGSVSPKQISTSAAIPVAQPIRAYDTETSLSHAAPAVHDGIGCDGCGNQPVVGVRYQSSRFQNFDLCSRCEGGGRYDHKGPFLKIRDPSEAGRLDRGSQGSNNSNSCNHSCSQQPPQQVVIQQTPNCGGGGYGRGYPGGGVGYGGVGYGNVGYGGVGYGLGG
jgi:hypothetical protein